MIVRLKGVKKVKSKGKTYYYHRKTMTRLPGAPGSAQFVSTLTTLNTKQQSRKWGADTLGSLTKEYRSSPEFAGLAPSTRQTYQAILDELKSLDGMPLALVTSEFLFAWRDKKMAERKRTFANRGLTVIQIMFNWGMRRGKVKTNPALVVERVRRPRDAPIKNRPWRPEELAVVLAEASPRLRVPVALAAYTGLRISDVLRAAWSCYDGAVFQARAQKTGVPIWVPVHPYLRELLAVAPRTNPQIVVGLRGAPLTRSALSTDFYRLIGRLRAEGRVGPGLSFHGLRHTLGTAIIEAGGTRAMAKAVLGHTTEQSSEHYSRTADRRQLAADAMALLENPTENRRVTP